MRLLLVLNTDAPRDSVAELEFRDGVELTSMLRAIAEGCIEGLSACGYAPPPGFGNEASGIVVECTGPVTFRFDASMIPDAPEAEEAVEVDDQEGADATVTETTGAAEQPAPVNPDPAVAPVGDLSSDDYDPGGLDTPGRLVASVAVANPMEQSWAEVLGETGVGGADGS